MAAAISKPVLSDLAAQTGQQVPSSHHIRPVGDRPADLANVDNESGAGIVPLVVVDLKKLNPNGPERRRKVVEAIVIGRACESDGFFVEGMLRVDGELFRFHLPGVGGASQVLFRRSQQGGGSEGAAGAGGPIGDSESLGLELERSHMGRQHAQHMAVNYYPPCPQPDLITDGLPVHKDPNAIPIVVDQWPSNNPPSSVRDASNAWGENIHRAIQWCAHKLGCSSPSYCLPITVNRPSPHGSETASPFSPLFILEKNDVKVEDVSKYDLATIAGTLSLLVPMAINIDELTTNWGPLWKVLCGIFMIMSLMSALIGLFTASFRAGSRARNLSSHCARMSFVVATIVLVLLIASKLGCVGCVAGAVLVLVMLVLTVLWIRSEEPTGRAAPEI